MKYFIIIFLVSATITVIRMFYKQYFFEKKFEKRIQNFNKSMNEIKDLFVYNQECVLKFIESVNNDLERVKTHLENCAKVDLRKYDAKRGIDVNSITDN